MATNVSYMPGVLPRVHFTCSFDPSRECFEVMEEVAQGIHGIYGVITHPAEGTTFALAISNDVDQTAAAAMWLKSFIGKLNMMTVEELSDMRGGIPRIDPKDCMAQFADSGTGVNSKGDDF